jgi:DNA-directed RNA polymerase subunit alpha
MLEERKLEGVFSIDVQKPSIDIVECTENYGKFVVTPLDRGLGTTLGNALRRVLISSLPGCAVSSVKIDGVLHEFSTIEGVKEDVTEIVLNLKQLHPKLYCPESEKIVRINATGPKVVTANDIIHDADVEIINPDLVIATLNDGAYLGMEIVISKGKGYVPAAQNKLKTNIIGQIAIDSLFTPIEKVNFTVEPTRVGQSIDHDKLTLEVWTNGTIKPDAAVSNAAKQLSDYMTLFINLADHVQGIEMTEEKEETKKNRLLDMTIEELELSVRSFNCLKRAGIHTVGELTQRDESDMLRVRNLGRKSLEEVQQKLASLGLKLKDSSD